MAEPATDLRKAIRDIMCTRLKAFAAMQLELAGGSPSPELRNHFMDSAKLMLEAREMIGLSK